MATRPEIKINADFQPLLDNLALLGVLSEVFTEVNAAREKHGKQDHLPFGTGPAVDVLGTRWGASLRPEYVGDLSRAASLADGLKARTDLHASLGTVTWLDILLEEVAEALAEDDHVRLRAELLQVSAMAATWITIIDGRDA